MNAPLAALLTGLVGLWTLAAHAEPAQGGFVASQRCEAYQSIRKRSNPDGATLQPGQRYRVVEVNKRDYDWLRVRLPDNATPLRWVPVGCGQVEDLSLGARQGTGSAAQGEACNVPGQHDGYVLAATWQPGFCEHVAYKGRKPECDALAGGDLQLNHLTLHGLWPNRQACGTRYGHCAGPALVLDESTRATLRPWMPNVGYGDDFSRYQWEKHGTCQTDMDANAYFRRAAELVRQLDATRAGQYIASNVGGAISQAAFYQKVSEEFGNPRAGNNFLLVCTRGGYLQEVRVSLPRALKPAESLVGVMDGQFAERRPGDRNACRDDRVLIEAPGL
ncbi:Ribonuclease I precursor [Pseudomonas sp. FeS53a]|uniref:ribonuclease T2 family protein n=1 Tax=Pseudomonas sp. FeS53a TaxID=1604022 RepID=UPI0005CA132E|nr:ribonuclease T(2) [Pseudomonas sp. FeS53a]KIV74084.1 Ribonuclease I precursor [Pseudomonas sp. FeS53a]